MSRPIPILFFGDAPVLQTGLSRISRDIAGLVATMPEYRVGFFGRGGHTTRNLPFQQYVFQPTAYSEWGETMLPSVWKDFAGNEQGVIFTIWDPSRLTWFGIPEYGVNIDFQFLKDFLTSGRFERWGYFPVDAFGVAGSAGPLTRILHDTIYAYDRVLAYSKFGQQILSRSSERPVDWIPHGIDLKVFYPRDRQASRYMLWPHDQTIGKKFIVGCVMTNQARKDWGTWARVCAELVTRFGRDRIRFWAHVDDLDRYWSLDNLLDDYDLAGLTKITLSGNFSDDQLAHFYSACDVTFLPSLGEGFGYPLVESQACGVPVVHPDYAAGPEFIWTGRSVASEAYRLDTRFNMVRPVLSINELTNALAALLGQSFRGELHTRQLTHQRVEHLGWKNLSHVWRRWFRDAAADYHALRGEE